MMIQTTSLRIRQVIAGLSWHGVIWAFTHAHGGNWHPLTTISHMFDCGVFGLRAGAHHFGNVLLHTAATIALFFVLRRLTGALWRSAFVAAVFAIHPLRVESVVWIAERKDVLSGFFFMLTLAAYLHYARKPSIWRYLTMSILFACGLMSKPMLVSLPIVLLLLDYWPLNRGQRSEVRTFAEIWWKLVAEKFPLFMLSIASAVATLIAQTRAIGSFEQLPLSSRVSQALLSYLTYIRQMFWPTKLAVFYPHSENGSALVAGSNGRGSFGRDYDSDIFSAKETTLPRGRLALVCVHVNSGNRDRSGGTARPR